MKLRLERDLAQGLGVSRDVLRKVRKACMAEEADWYLGSEGIVYTEAGFEKLRAELGRDAVPSDAQDRGRELVMVCVKRVLRGGIRLLCSFEGRDVVVAVRSTEGYRVSQEIRVEAVEGRGLWYVREDGRKRR